MSPMGVPPPRTELLQTIKDKRLPLAARRQFKFLPDHAPDDGSITSGNRRAQRTGVETLHRIQRCVRRPHGVERCLSSVDVRAHVCPSVMKNHKKRNDRSWKRHFFRRPWSQKRKFAYHYQPNSQHPRPSFSIFKVKYMKFRCFGNVHRNG